MTHREYLTRLSWLNEQWNIPTRTDYFLAQIAQEIRRVLSRNPNRIKLKHFMLKFGTNKDSIHSNSESSKSIWFKILGLKNPDDRETSS